MTELESTVSDDTLERVSMRAFVFLSAVSADATIRAALARRGYTGNVHQQGWTLVDEVSGRISMPAPAGVSAGFSVDDAVEEIDAWDEPNFTVARAALVARFPAQCEYVFANGLQPARGRASVLAVMTFLRRLDDLERSDARVATREQDHAALSTLSDRGIGPAQRAHLAALVAVVQRGEAPAASTGQTAAPPAVRRNPKLELYEWLREWSAVARVQVAQRKQLIALGLASPRKARAAAAPKPPTPPV